MALYARVSGSAAKGRYFPEDGAVIPAPPRFPLLLSRRDASIGKTLSDRELAALVALATTDRKSAVASLGISLQTFKNLLSHAYEKLDAYGELDAMRKMGWLRVPSSEAVSLELERRRSLEEAEALRDAAKALRVAAEQYVLVLRGVG